MTHWAHWLGALPLLWLLGAATTAAVYGRTLRALWREPVLLRPVLIIESDDWGPGPPEQAVALDRLREALLRHRDAEGRPACMTLGVTLAVADTAALSGTELGTYRRVGLDDARYSPLREAMERGAAVGVFAPQLHGMEHYWPDALLAAAREDDKVRAWLRAPGAPLTEALPSHLQSRWTDASRLPSRALDEAAVGSAVREEVAAYAALFGGPPAVVVPPTFVWTPTVERAWARAGVRVVVTPGQRYGGRGAHGEVLPAGGAIRNAERGSGGVRYVVRDVYFEPERGHRAQRVVAALARRSALGRPTLVETHRSNFLGGPQALEAALGEVERMLAAVREAEPRTAFLSTAALVDCLVRRDPQWVEGRGLPRLHVWLRRVCEVPRLGRLARLGALGVPAGLLLRWTRPRPQQT